MYAKVEQYNKFQCTYHPVLTINSGTVLLQLYPTLHNIILKQIPHITFHPQIFQYVLLKDKELIFFKSSMHVIFRIHETYSVKKDFGGSHLILLNSFICKQDLLLLLVFFLSRVYRLVFET